MSNEDIEGRINCKGGAFDGNYVCCKQREDNIDPLSTDDISGEACGYDKKQMGWIDKLGDSEQNTVPGEFPWIAAIFRKKYDGDYNFIASGSLIHPKVILTVVHKLRG